MRPTFLILLFLMFRPAAASDILIRNGHVMTVSNGTIRNGSILVRDGKIFAVGDCNFGCVGGPPDWGPGGKGIAPIPKISYPGEEQAHHAAANVKCLDYQVGCFFFFFG